MPRVELDPSLIGGGGNAFATAYQNALANNFKNQAAQQDIDINQYKMDAARQEQQQSNALAQLLGRQGFDAKTPQGQSELYSAGGVKGAQTYLKGQGDLAKVNADTAKHQSDTRKVDIENSFKRLELVGQFLGGSTDQATHTQMRAQMAANPELAEIAKMIPEQYDPNAVAMFKKMSMPEKDRLAAEHQQITREETGRHNLAGERISVDNNTANNATSRLNNQESNATSRANNASSVGATMRGQNMTDARSRESNSASISKPFEVTGPDGKPVLVRQDKAGNISTVEGFAPKSGAEKPMTDAQSKAALFGSRMESSNKIIDDLAKSGTNKSVPFSNAGFGVGGAVTAASSGSQQQLQQAKRDFINATLRRESGAVISPSEFDNAEKQYFPQVGDSKEVEKQKAGNRAIATRGVQAEIPKAQRGVVKEIIGGGGNSDIDALLNKYK